MFELKVATGSILFKGYSDKKYSEKKANEINGSMGENIMTKQSIF